MSVSTVITLGFGNFGGINFLPTLGYGDYGSDEGIIWSGATNYGKKRKRDYSKPDSPEYLRYLARSIETENRLRIEAEKAKNELLAVKKEIAVEKPKKSDLSDVKARFIEKNAILAQKINYQNYVNKKLQIIEAELDRIVSTEISQRINALFAERIADDERKEQEISDILFIVAVMDY